MKKYLLFASAILAFASCANDSYLGTEDEKHIANGDQAITFGFDVPTPTRAEGAAAATKLNNQFIVYAEKNEDQTAAGTNPGTGNLVINNYVVNYVTNSAYTSTSNTKDWEYVGFKFNDASATIPTTSYSTNITPNSGADVVQTIKFWDDAASSYTFTAVSALPADIQNGRVTITKNTSGTDQYAKGYTIVLKKTDGTTPVYPSLDKLYFADRNNIAKGDGYTHNPVKLTFRNSQSQVRVGIYETIPGYKVSAIHFFKQYGTTEYNDGASTPTNAFGAVCNNISATNFEGTLTVTYGNGTNAALDQPIVSVTTPSTPATDLVLGTNYSTLTTTGTAKFLGETATAATYDKADATYTLVMPQEGNTTNLKLKVNYTLYNEITKETITITGKTAEIPGKYLAWKPNFKYTYLFKLTDDDLNPITFDAVVVEDEAGNQETVTTVDNPSITTYAKGQNPTQAAKAEYPTGSTIYVAVDKGGTVPTLTVGTNANLYLVTNTTGTGATQEITEESVANALAHGTKDNNDNPTSWTVTGVGMKSLIVTTTGVPSLTAGTTIPDADSPTGVAITVNNAKFTPTAAGTYAFEFIDTSDSNKKYYKIIKVVTP
jgi:hypothetical protein